MLWDRYRCTDWNQLRVVSARHRMVACALMPLSVNGISAELNSGSRGAKRRSPRTCVSLPLRWFATMATRRSCALTGESYDLSTSLVSESQMSCHPLGLYSSLDEISI